jgi:hypothetical protein
MTVYNLKPKFQALLMPLTNHLFRIGMTANAVTVAAMLASVLYGAVMFLAPVSRWPFLLLPAFLLLRMALNAIDGMLARQYGQASKIGAILNEVGDVVSDAALYAPFATGIATAFAAGASTIFHTHSCVVSQQALTRDDAKRRDGAGAQFQRVDCLAAPAEAPGAQLRRQPHGDAVAIEVDKVERGAQEAGVHAGAMPQQQRFALRRPAGPHQSAQPAPEALRGTDAQRDGARWYGVTLQDGMQHGDFLNFFSILSILTILRILKIRPA